MGMKFGQLKNAGNKNDEGVWKVYEDDFEVCLRPAGNRDYDRAIGKMMKKDRRAVRRGGKVSDQKLERMTKTAAAEHILVGWKNLEDDETGQNVPYSKEKALELFESNYQFYKEILDMAADLQTEENEDEDEQVGNS